MTDQKTTLEFAGDNPCVVLFDDDGTVQSAVSFWNANFSLAGPGQALFCLTATDGEVKARLFADNPAAADFFKSFNQHFLGFETTNWTGVKAEPARFNARWEGPAFKLGCQHANGSIDVEWSDLASPYILRSQSKDFGKEAGRSYEVSSVIISATDGAIRVDGQTLAGSINASYGALPRSAFLAFCETWARL